MTTFNDEFADENSFGSLYIIEPEGFCMQGCVIIIASSREKMKELFKPIKEEWKYNSDLKFEVTFDEHVIINPVDMDTVVLNCLDMV